MGLNNQGLHNNLFRGFLKPWEAYTGATISWIDLAQADYNAFLQQSIATGTVAFDIIEMGAPFEGDTAGKGLLDPMPDWVATQIDMDDYVNYLKAPVGTWDGKTYRVSIDGDTHTLAYRTDYYTDATLKAAWTAEGHAGDWAPPTTWEQVNEQSKFLAGKTDPLTGAPAYGILDPLKYLWGGFGFYFLEDRAVAYSKVPGNPAWLFDPDTMKPLVNNPGWVQAIQDVIDLKNTPDAYPPDQINADPNTTAFQQFLAGTGAQVMWWGDVGSNAKTSDTSVVGPVVGFDIDPGADRYYDWTTGAWVDERQPGSEQRLHRLGRLCHQPRLERRAEAQVHVVRRGPSGRQGPVALDGGVSVRLPAVPQLALQHRRVGGGRLRPRLHRGLPVLERRQLQPPERGERAAHPGHLPVLLARRGRAGQGSGQRRHGAADRGQHRGGLGGDHQPDRARQPAQAVQGLARPAVTAGARR